jgi:LacI family transcriptional regulator
MPTIKDVAELAGVSIATVSHVINGTRFVSDELKKRVQDAIEELGYYPNPLGQGFRTGKSFTIAVFLPDPRNAFFQVLAQGIEEQAQRNHYSISYCNTREEPSQEKMYVSLLSRRAVDGFIVAPTSRGDKNLQPLADKKIPLVLIDRRIEGFPVDQVFSDSELGAYKATKHLLELGHRHIGVLLGIREIETIKERLSGYRMALEEYSVPFDENLVVEGYSQMEEGFVAADQLLENKKVTAIFGSNNQMMLGALMSLKKRRLRCPEEISLIGFDDLDWTAVISPALSVVDQNPYEMGYQAAELLFQRLRDKQEEIEPQIIEIPTRMIIRESTDIPHVRT